METNLFTSKNVETILSAGSVTWKAPSNIALVKYWGKSDPQIPKNTSLSFTLSNSFTETKLDYNPLTDSQTSDAYQYEVWLDGEKKDDFKPKILSFFEQIEAYVPFLKRYKFEIHTHNSFPHSSGIASSASSFAALSLCIMSLEKLYDPAMTEAYFYQKASFLARLGSGSATRSVKGNLVVWGKHEAIKESSDLYGVQFPFEIHPIFKDFQDTILLVDKGQKKVSSSVGHGLMDGHPFATQRFQQAQDHIVTLTEIMQKGDLNGFIKLVEQEALSLHAMMMTADPYFILMHPHTLSIIQNIWDFRKQTDIPICFTLDAGANVHVLYPHEFRDVCIDFINQNLSKYCQNNQYICDHVGEGAIRTSF